MQELMQAAVFDVNVVTLKPYRDAYYFIAKDDSSAFVQFLANAALHRTLHTSGGKSLRCNEATSSHYRALQMANQRIQDSKESHSDGMIATVLMMAAYNVSIGSLLKTLKPNDCDQAHFAGFRNI